MVVIDEGVIAVPSPNSRLKDKEKKRQMLWKFGKFGEIRGHNTIFLHPAVSTAPRVIALGFQLANGHLHGPRDMFDDVGFDEARRLCNALADHMRCHGPFAPHRLPMEEMEYTTLPLVMGKLQERWEELPKE